MGGFILALVLFALVRRRRKRPHGTQVLPKGATGALAPDSLNFFRPPHEYHVADSTAEYETITAEGRAYVTAQAAPDADAERTYLMGQAAAEEERAYEAVGGGDSALYHEVGPAVSHEQPAAVYDVASTRASHYSMASPGASPEGTVYNNVNGVAEHTAYDNIGVEEPTYARSSAPAYALVRGVQAGPAASSFYDMASGSSTNTAVYDIAGSHAAAAGGGGESVYDVASPSVTLSATIPGAAVYDVAGDHAGGAAVYNIAGGHTGIYDFADDTARTANDSSYEC